MNRPHMKYPLMVATLLVAMSGYGQLLTWSPGFVRESGTSMVEITVDAGKGNRGLNNYSTTSDVYVHIGAITSLSTSMTDWRYVKFSSFNTPNASAQCSYLGSNRWKFSINGGLRGFFGMTNAAEKILKVAILFRNGAGSVVQRNADGTDMFVPVYEDGLQVRIDLPLMQPMFAPLPETITKSVGDNIAITANASDVSAMKLYLNGTQLATQSGVSTISANPVITASGMQVILAEASIGAVTKRDSVKFFISAPAPVAPVPPGLRNGINMEAGDTSVTLVFHAPGKNSVHVLGDFNNWTQSSAYQMTKSPDGRHWLRISGLTPGAEYAYQFFVDGALKVADYHAEKVLDPWNDQYIPSATYPNLKPYPTGKATGIVSVLQTAKPKYNWKVANFSRPDKRNLLIYELLLRDFGSTPNWKLLIDTISYLKRLGVNVIQLMPFNEFEGNNSWGYNPSFYFAPDKYYGTENELRRFIDTCHSNGMAVVMDIALNHSFGQSPMVQLYMDASTGKPAPGNPWFNPDATHPFNVGYDFNHESADTKAFVDRVVEHWLVNYKIDGFRWDLSKGFTQVNNPVNVGAWGAYDASRIALWKRIYDKMQGFSSGSYCILEHFAANVEEIELSDYGMLLWGNANHNFNEATMGYIPNSDFSHLIAKNRNWNHPHLIGYQESHDEERLMYKNLNFGNSSNSSHNTKSLPIALERSGMAAAFWAMMPGPKMLWQFGELGYDYSITYCPSNGTVPQPYPDMQCRTDAKPIRWDYRQDANRQKLYNVYAALLSLRNMPKYLSTFTTNTNVDAYLTSAFKTLRLRGDSLKVVVIGNFGVAPVTDTVRFPSSGTWYDHLNRSTLSATGSPQSISLMPGQYHVYLDRQVGNDLVTSLNDLLPGFSDQSLIVYPNPAAARVTLAYELPISGRVDISMWNTEGRMVSRIFSGVRSKGRHTQVFDMSSVGRGGLPAGQYFIVLDVEGRRMRKAFMLVK